jgi:hypothetical protein
MNKRIIFFICFIGFITGLYAEAPELRNVMPNSWRKVTKLTAVEEQAFRRENSALFSEMKEWMEDDDLGWRDNNKLEFYFIYRQIVGKEVFYRVLCTNSSNPQFNSSSIRFAQYLIYKNVIVFGVPYNQISVLQRYTMAVYKSIDIIEGIERAKGILLTELDVDKKIDDYMQWDKKAYLKGQLAGCTGSRFYPMEEIDKMINDEKYSVIQIYASDCLVDPNIPLRYSLQNAFDGDPSTSYVENTEDDLMGISVQVPFSVNRYAVINGYAQNITLYKNNNRVKTVSIFFNLEEFRNLELADNTLGWLFIEVDDGSGGLSVTDIYHGDRYNDTCISEYNVYSDKYGWLFGDINE